MKQNKFRIWIVALALLIGLAGCAPKDAGVAILIGWDKKELPQGELP